MSFFLELKRRNVFKVAASYAIVSWIVLQVADTTFPALNIPAWVMSLITILILLGFPIAMFMAWAFEMTPDGIKPTADVPLEESIRAQTGQKMNYLVIGGLAFALALVMLDAYVFTDTPKVEGDINVIADAKAAGTVQTATSVTAPSTNAATPEQIADEKSLAILPFSNLSSDPEQDYFADGLTEELINTMAGVDGLLVTGRTSSFFFKNSTQPLNEIASTLGVANILQGSVRKSGTALRITVQLTEIDTGFTLWSQTFDRQLDDIFVIQDEIAKDVGTALSVTLGAGDFAQPGMTRNVDAYVAYMQANDKVAENTGESLLEAIVHAESAVSLDPDFARGWLTLANAYFSARAFAPLDQTAGFEEKQAEALATAASLAPDLRENKIVAYSELKMAGRYAEAEQLLVQLGDLYGQDADLNSEYGVFLLQVGRVQESKVALERARRQDPLSARISAFLTQSMRTANVPAETIRAELSRGLSLGGFEPLLYNNLSLLEMEEQNWPAAMAATELQTSREVQSQLMTYFREGRSQEGLAYLRERMNDPNVVLVIRLRLLPMYAALYGDPRLALELLQPNITIPNLLEIIWHDDFSAMRKLPEFKTFMQEMGLVDYWRTTGRWADKCQPAGDDFTCE